MKGLMIGCGAMARTYVPVLRHMNVDVKVLGRGEASAAAFQEATGLAAGTGPLDQQLAALDFKPDFAIVAVDVVQLAAVTTQLIGHGIRKILLEKPGGTDPSEVEQLAALAAEKDARVYIAYNRRFFASALRARELVREDGGVVSSKFDFTELLSRIPVRDKDPRELANFFYANSTHLLDLHGFLCGDIQEVSAHAGGSLEWHPAGSVFAGFGRTDRGTVFSYHANWECPGRWRLELMTPKRRLVFEPLEELHQQTPDGFKLQAICAPDELDTRFKPGLYRMLEAFLADNAEILPLISAQSRRLRSYAGLLRQA